MDRSRRRFLGMSAAALAGVTLIPTLSSCNSQPVAPTTALSDGKPNSNFAGVAIGTITYSWRSMPGGLENLIKYCKESNISNLELMGNDLEMALGAPENPTTRFRQEALRAGVPDGGRNMTYTPEQQAEIDKYNVDIKNFRIKMDWDKVEAVRQRFVDEGIAIHVVKTQPSRVNSEEEIDYAFKLAKAMGAIGVSDELTMDAVKKIAPYAEKHDMFYVMHNHMQYATDEWSAGPDPALAVSPKIMLNFDQGHYFGSTGKHPVEFIKKYKDRILTLHLKDKTGPNAEQPNTNQVWGQGQTPLEDLLCYLRDEKLPIFGDIELEYEIKPWSNAVKEVSTCVKYARQILSF